MVTRMDLRLDHKINPDLCRTAYGYSCPEDCNSELLNPSNIIGWTIIAQTYKKTDWYAFVYECPICFAKIAIHVSSPEEIQDFYQVN